MASVEDEERRPAAILVIVRSDPAAPTLTVDDGLAPAKVYAFPPMVAPLVPATAAVVEPEPSATSPALLAAALGPIATLLVPAALESARLELA